MAIALCGVMPRYTVERFRSNIAIVALDCVAACAACRDRSSLLMQRLSLLMQTSIACLGSAGP